MKGVTVITHPLVQHNLTRLRDRRTGPQEFRRVLSEVAALMLYEATRSFAVTPVPVKTPLANARGFRCGARWCWCRCCAPGWACWIPSCS